MWFRILWPLAMLVLFFLTLGLVGSALPLDWGPWSGLGLFVLLAVPFALVANLWGPLALYRFRARRRFPWARQAGFVPVDGTESLRWMDEVRKLFRRPEKGIVLSILQRGRLSLVDYSYLRSYGSSRPHGSGVEAREAVTLLVGSTGRPLPRIDAVPMSLSYGLLRAMAERQFAMAGLDALLGNAVGTGDESFDEAFRVTARNPDEARRTLTDRSRARLLQANDVRLYCRGDALIVHRNLLLSNREAAELTALAEELLREH